MRLPRWAVRCWWCGAVLYGVAGFAQLGGLLPGKIALPLVGAGCALMLLAYTGRPRPE